MHRIGVLGLLVMFGCAAASAQGADVSISVLTTDTQPVINVWNDHNLPVEAFLITEDLGGNGGRLTRIYYDVHINRRSEVPVPPGASQQVPFPHIVERPLPVPELRAVVFSDGSTEGDQVWVSELLRRRSILIDRLQEAIESMDQISSQNLSRPDAIALLQRGRQVRRQSTFSAPPEERVLNDQIFDMIIKNIDDARTVGGRAPELPKLYRALRHHLSLWLLDLRAAEPHLDKQAIGQTPEPTAH